MTFFNLFDECLIIYYLLFQMRRLLVILFFFLSFQLFGQKGSADGIIDSLLENGAQKEALKLVENYIQDFERNMQFDSLPEYLVLYGRVVRAIQPERLGNKKLLFTYQNWKKLSIEPSFQRKLAKSLANWYEYTGNISKAYEVTLLALDWARKESGSKPQIFADLYLNLGGLAIKNMDLSAAKKHLTQVLSLNLSEKDPENIYFANSYLGNIAYFTSNLDSAAYYYEKTLKAIDLLEPSPRNQLYRKSIILNNLAGVQMAQSDFNAAEKSMNQTILFREKYMATNLDAIEYQKVLQDYLSSLDNLAGLYKQLGHYSRAKQLLEFSFRRKIEELGENDLATTKSRILLGQIYFDIQELEISKRYLEDGLGRLQNTDQESSYWQGDALHTLARMEDFLQNEDVADSLYRQAKLIFDEELQGEYDVIYLDFLKNFSRFLAENRKTAEAISLSQKARKYLEEINSDNLFLDFNQSLNQAAIHELGGQYSEALRVSNSTFELWNRLINRRNSVQDSIQAVFLKPKIILIKNRSLYKLENKSAEILKSIEKELLEGLQIIDSQSDFLFEPSDISIQLDINREYFEFLEQIELDLYQVSGKEIYLDRLLTYHEHARYRQIRSRLQKNQSVKFGGIPTKILLREENLKDQLKKSFLDEGKNLVAYSKAKEEWVDFLDSLRVHYPKYYQLHFETSESALKRVYSSLDPSMTYLRYFQVGQDWMVLVIKEKYKKLIPLNTKSLSPILETLADQSSKNKFQPLVFHKIYQLVWEPIRPHLETHRITIIPEGLLFNLSFDALSKQAVNQWSELVKYSLIQDHSFSYQYSLLLLEKQKRTSYQTQLAAFAPGFFDGMKKTYQAAFFDKQYVDKNYLELIPQPFTRRLVEEISSKFESKTYLEGQSTVSNFKKEAGKSRIIHLGTHAFSSNVNPSDTHLVFAKSTENPLEPHELFASEIYELNLNSELAVLLACESGKPTYAAGEGMISLAHAFNYSGTQSMLIGLGKIDEKTSVDIADDFYSFLEEGLPKDVALREAKLNYIAQANGRELDPSFWTGLIILGNPDPVEIEAKSEKWIILFSSGLIFMTIFWILRKKLKEN
ncbi:MAG TPA: hypothetical protein DEQ87_03460 [Algoriphagus sp.]|nr:hypothetical protein [Algoriphagus sp.]